MKISIHGLGYVGAVTAGCLADDGHTVIGVDVDAAKTELVNRGDSPIVERDVPALIAAGVRAGRLRATTDARDAVLAADLSLVCVGTPSQANGGLDLQYVRRACSEIGAALRDKASGHVVVVRSTMLPGSLRGVVIPALEEAAGQAAGEHFGVCINPEFLREGTAVHDFRHPPKTVIGALDAASGELVAQLYAGLSAPMVRTTLEIAEMVKYADNAWHALKVGFANEVGTLCKALGLDSHEVMRIFCSDTKLNIAPTYLTPGFAFGGSCLPKDVRALTHKARTLDLELPILAGILPSNELHVRRALELVLAQGHKKVGVLGFSFKEGTDDLRESPVVELVERLLGKGHELRLYDENVRLARLTGANRSYILNRIPHLAQLMVDRLDDVLAHADTLVIGTKDEAFRALASKLRPGQRVVDLVRVVDWPAGRPGYEGICW